MPWETSKMGVREDCRHYSRRSMPTGDMVQRCRVDMATAAPFTCPQPCLFFEARSISDAGWQRFEQGAHDLPDGDR